MTDIALNAKNYLEGKKNLLAFSSGIDSVALFFLLLDNNLSFDIAIVNHNLRKESIDEVLYAKELAKQYDKKIYIQELNFSSLENLEANARAKRYQFFDEIIVKHKYNNLLTAHQLDDKLEWFLMQLSKGAGLVELLGMKTDSIRNIRNDDFIIEQSYNIIRPLLSASKKSLKSYLDKNNIKYFIDSSNADIKFKRNYFRQKFSSEFLEESINGIRKSFEYMHKDLELFPELNLLYQDKQYVVYENDIKHTSSLVDKACKQYGILLSASQRNEIIQTRDCVIGGKTAIFINENEIHIAPYLDIVIPKKIREEYRIKKIPVKIRGFLYKSRSE